ncbi:hypothetical protein AeRB84_016262 [Aphanomyces euteiches]|nr:hypothetical protein AeRB84_016262 [Aphanomyces euteiches]
MARKTAYTPDDMGKAVNEILERTAKPEIISKRYGIPARTLRTHVALAVRGTSSKNTTKGPAPLLPSQIEGNIAAWITCMQQDGHSAKRKNIMDRADKALAQLHGHTAKKVTSGWFRGFMQRHDGLHSKKAQKLSKSRSAVTQEIILDFYHELVHALSQVDMEPSRIFNMDEASFSPSKTSEKVLVSNDTKNACTTDPQVSDHITVIACVGADGSKIPSIHFSRHHRFDRGM